MFNEYADFPKLLAAMKSIAPLAQPWTGVLFRSAPPKWAGGREMLTGVGSMNSGARYNAPGSFPAVYGSTTPELAMIESLAFQRRAGLPPERALPLVFKGISVQVERLLDLTNAKILANLDVTADGLRRDQWWLARAQGDESLTQAIGRAAHACGVQAILADSAQTTVHGHNVVVFPDHIRPPSRIKVLRGKPR